MQCPVCGKDCVSSAQEILSSLPAVFLPCEDCRMQVLDKRLPPPLTREPAPPCSCGKRFIDAVFAHIWAIMVEEGDLGETDPLIAAGTPLIHPGFAVDRPPFLPKRSLLLLSQRVTPGTAERLVREVFEVRGVVKTGNGVPGISSVNLDEEPIVHELLAGCDVRADVIPVGSSALVFYKQQSRTHIEFPRAGYPKIRSVEQHVGTPPVSCFVDACCGVGTLGIAAASLGVPHVIMNDAWYASAFWSAFNLEVNRDLLNIGRVRLYKPLQDMAKVPVRRTPEKIAETEGDQRIEVYQGDFHELPSVLVQDSSPLTALDLFQKSDRVAIERITRDWYERVGGALFIP